MHISGWQTFPSQIDSWESGENRTYWFCEEYGLYTLWLFNIAMENGPFIDGLPIKMVIFHGYVK
jgi:hypothetical protein